VPKAPKKSGSARRKPTPEELRGLDVEIAFMEGLVKRDSSHEEALLILAEDYTRRQRFAEGLRIDERLSQLRPQDPMVHYNLACSLSLTGQIELAVDTLKKAVNLGFADFAAMAKDADLKNIREHPEYKKLRAKARRLSVRET
jgi:tetratricopeptide (TPR) repeat protein